ncbi:hypothetical protein GCM10022289_44600 [Pedobacter jeongneungensis]|uniref:Mobilization protein n=1 Tax=Pedobacter jeongneungensis TaxID=947309 RepID=A0ABP8BPW6_9SPHI
MARAKQRDTEKLLKHVLRIRIDEKTFKRLEKLVATSDCRNPCAAARKIITGERINVFYRNDEMGEVMEELAMIRKEIRSIGININQQTHFFNASDKLSQKWFYVNRTLELYKPINEKTERLLEIVNQLAIQWLQKS